MQPAFRTASLTICSTRPGSKFITLPGRKIQVSHCALSTWTLPFVKTACLYLRLRGILIILLHGIPSRFRNRRFSAFNSPISLMSCRRWSRNWVSSSTSGAPTKVSILWMNSLAHFGSLLIFAERASGFITVSLERSFNRHPFAAFRADVCLDAGEPRKGVQPATMRASCSTNSLRHQHPQERLLNLGDRDGSDQSAALVTDQIGMIATLDGHQAAAAIFVAYVGMRHNGEVVKAQRCRHSRILSIRSKTRSDALQRRSERGSRKRRSITNSVSFTKHSCKKNRNVRILPCYVGSVRGRLR